MKIVFVLTVFLFLAACFFSYRIVTIPFQDNKTTYKKSSMVSSDLDDLLS